MARASVGNVIRRDLKYFGLLRTLADVFFRAVNCLVYFRIVRAMKLETVRPEYLADQGLSWSFFSDDQLTTLAVDPDNEITPQFLGDALAKGDRCYGAMDGDTLVTYSWLSTRPTDADGLYLHFDPRYVYLYKAFTNPKCRGHRANAACVHHCLQIVLSEGHRGLIADIDSNNFASLHAAFRMGFEQFGRATIFKLRRFARVHYSRGCRNYGYYFATESHEEKSLATEVTEGTEVEDEMLILDELEPQIPQMTQV